MATDRVPDSATLDKSTISWHSETTSPKQWLRLVRAGTIAMGPDIATLPLAAVMDHCRAESDKYQRSDLSDGRFCREALRRALVARDQEAWGAIFAHYSPLVLRWVQYHPARHVVGESDEFWQNRSFERFWGAVGPDQFENFATLGTLLSYLRLCARSAIDDAARRARHERTAPATLDQLDRRGLVATGPEAVSERLSGEDLWLAICAEVDGAAEARIARLSFLQGLKPREIYELDPEGFFSVAEIYRIKRNLLERLRRNPAIRAFLEAP